MPSGANLPHALQGAAGAWTIPEHPQVCQAAILQHQTAQQQAQHANETSRKFRVGIHNSCRQTWKCCGATNVSISSTTWFSCWTSGCHSWSVFLSSCSGSSYGQNVSKWSTKSTSASAPRTNCSRAKPELFTYRPQRTSVTKVSVQCERCTTVRYKFHRVVA